MRNAARYRLAAAACALSLLPAGLGAAPGESEETAVLNLWVDAKYPQAYDQGRRYRESFGPKFIVDYMIGTSACQVRQFRSWGHDFLSSVYREHQDELAAGRRQILLEEVRACEPEWGTPHRQRAPRYPGGEGLIWGRSLREVPMAELLSSLSRRATSTSELLGRAPTLGPAEVAEVAECVEMCSPL